MKCSQIRKMISPYVDDELGPDERKGFMAHIENCIACRKELEEVQGLHRLFASADRFEAPLGFAGRVTARIEEGEETWLARLRRFLAVPFFMRTVEVAFALAVVLIGMISGSLLVADRTAERQPTVQESFSLDLFRAAPPDSLGGAYMKLAGVADEK